MRTIDIFVSAPADVQKEHAIAEQAIRSVAVEFNLSVHVCYSNPLRESGAENSSVQSVELLDKSSTVLCPCFWEYPESETDDFVDRVRDGSQYTLVICIPWSQRGAPTSQACFKPCERRPGA